MRERGRRKGKSEEEERNGCARRMRSIFCAAQYGNRDEMQLPGRSRGSRNQAPVCFLAVPEIRRLFVFLAVPGIRRLIVFVFNYSFLSVERKKCGN